MSFEVTESLTRQIGQMIFWAPLVAAAIGLIASLWAVFKRHSISSTGRTTMMVCAAVCAGYANYFAWLAMASGA